MIANLIERIKNEPALFTGLVSMSLITFQEFGLDLTAGQETALNGLTVALLALFVRKQVTPNRTINWVDVDGDGVNDLDVDLPDLDLR